MKTLTSIKRCVPTNLLYSRLLQNRLFKNGLRLSSNESFKFDDLKINLALAYQTTQKPDSTTLTFGTTFSDHMFQVEWTHFGGWGVPQITPLHYFQMHPGAKVFHYGQAAFEGMKAFRYSNQKVALFRPELNIQRLLTTAERVSLPSFDCEELLKCLKKLVSVDMEWVPDLDMSSLYIRPTFIGIENSLGVSSAKSALLYIVTCPVGPYFKCAITKPVSLLADPNYVRAWPGGAGCFKLAANYAPTLYVQKLAQDQGLDQVLWLIGKDYQVAEAGAMNVFFFIRNENEYELATPSLDGTILPGVVRQSILDLAREWKEFTISERIITMKEVMAAHKENRLLEIFLCGTACSLCPVNLIRFMQQDIEIPTMQRENPLYLRFLKALMDIQYGRVESEWSVPVE